MKVVIDISPPLYERAQRTLVEGKYRSLAQLASVALENQLVLEAQEENETETHLAKAQPADRVGGSPPVDIRLRAFADLAIPNGLSPSTLGRSDAAKRDPVTVGWLWGIINRVLPIKVAARSLLVAAQSPATSLEQSAGLSAQRAHALAKWISASYGTSRPSREDSLLTGLPSREPLYRARQRFADSIFGREDRKGNVWGALFELGLAGTGRRGGKTYAGLTREGLSFAALPNPVIDFGDLSGPLSSEEIGVYLSQVVLRVPREGHCFESLLGALQNREQAVEELSEISARSLPRDLAPAAVSTMKIGALGRMHDLGLVTRRKVGRSARFAITEGGQRALDELHHRGGAANDNVEAQR